MMNSPEDDVTKGDILIVDDTLENLQVLSSVLTEQRYKVRGVSSGPMALTAARSAPLDLILLDIKMPDMDGYEVCRRLKAEPGSREIPVIFISALDEPLDKVKAFEVGGVEANEHLERRVEERTQELSLRLQELEARDKLLNGMDK